MEEKEYNVVTLEHGIEYTEVQRLSNNDNTYVFLSNLSNPEDFCIRKIVTENDEDYIVGLDSDEEFDKILELFGKEYLT